MALVAFTACGKSKNLKNHRLQFGYNAKRFKHFYHKFLRENYNQTEIQYRNGKKTAQNLFNTFCTDLKTQADGQGFKVFANTWATFQLQNTLREKIDEKKWSLPKQPNRNATFPSRLPKLHPTVILMPPPLL